MNGFCIVILYNPTWKSEKDKNAYPHFFSPLFQDFSMQPPTQELVVRDLHDNTWTFRHIYRGERS